MNFLQSVTVTNLARSFAGESQARNRYTFYAQQARMEKQEALARLFEQTAENERAHAQEFLEKIQKYAEKSPLNFRIDAGYPYDIGNTAQNLQFAADGERDEYQNAYPGFAELAKKEGYAEIAQLWMRIAGIEQQHCRTFTVMHMQLTNGTLYHKEQPVSWRCLNCGYVHSGTEPWQICPVCGKPIGWVALQLYAKG